ncbi:MAG: hypothetical protein ACM33T_14535 [Solirubrobacterales bacterium]
MPPRIARGNSIIPLMLGPIGIGIPKWLPLVVLYFAVVFGLASLDWAMAARAATVAAAIGPGLIGLVDLGLRLRVTHYQWVNPAGGTMVTEASLLDRLTFAECGWYLPILVLPLPLWLGGIGLSIALVRDRGLL